ncbi:PadR family transcriptional regulator [bacterium]|nr:PadR family transcriptional regulator [bacterium]
MLTKLEKDNLEIFVLTILRSTPSYGYKIIARLSPIVKISESTLYPILRRLEAAGELETYNVEVNGRIRNYYRIKEKGIKRVDTFKQDWENIRNIYNYILRNKQ